jgi:GNAT superfamily N-acetyltransferase
MDDQRPTPARTDEATAVTALLAAQLEEHDITLERALLSERVADALAGDGRTLILVARDEGRPVGLAFLSFPWTLERGGKVLWVEELYVVPECRGRGIGGRLLAAALDLARERGCLAVELDTDGNHARAGNLYARAGFQGRPRVHWTLPLGD